MPGKHDLIDNPNFTMTAPGDFGRTTEFGFWFTTGELYLLDFVEAMACVARVHSEESERDDIPVLVDIGDEYDPDEAWHWIRKDLEEATTLRFIDRESVWADAIRWLL